MTTCGNVRSFFVVVENATQNVPYIYVLMIIREFTWQSYIKNRRRFMFLIFRCLLCQLNNSASVILLYTFKVKNLERHISSFWIKLRGNYGAIEWLMLNSDTSAILMIYICYCFCIWFAPSPQGIWEMPDSNPGVTPFPNEPPPHPDQVADYGT